MRWPNDFGMPRHAAKLAFAAGESIGYGPEHNG
jgi:hypothetical protein